MWTPVLLSQLQSLPQGHSLTDYIQLKYIRDTTVTRNCVESSNSEESQPLRECTACVTSECSIFICPCHLAVGTGDSSYVPSTTPKPKLISQAFRRLLLSAAVTRHRYPISVPNRITPPSSFGHTGTVPSARVARSLRRIHTDTHPWSWV